MPLLPLTTPPSEEHFIPLREHQQETPESFFGARPVVHFHGSNASILVAKDQLESQEALNKLRAPDTGKVANSHVNGAAEGTGTEEIELGGVDVWITSQNVLLYSPTASHGVQIPYPTIALHATTGKGLYMQLDLTDRDRTNDDEDIETVEMTLIPTSPPASTAPAESEVSVGLQGTATPGRSQTELEKLFAALSACADLHPDPGSPMSEDDEPFADMAQSGDDNLLAGGNWITSDNIDQFTDADGNFTGPGAERLNGIQVLDASGGAAEGLGPGAGTVRTADAAKDGEDVGEEEAKWQRTE